MLQKEANKNKVVKQKKKLHKANSKDIINTLIYENQGAKPKQVLMRYKQNNKNDMNEYFDEWVRLNPQLAEFYGLKEKSVNDLQANNTVKDKIVETTKETAKKHY